jgi:hypothetical protein
MFNPLVDSFEDLNDTQLQEKIQDLSRRYFQTRNPELQNQIAVILDMFKQEQTTRLYKKQNSDNDDEDSDLDNLINID